MTSQKAGVDCVLWSPLWPNVMLHTPYRVDSTNHPSGSKPNGSNTTSSCSSILRRSAPSRTRQLGRDRKSTRLNSSHITLSYAVFCLKKKNEHLLAHHT